MYWSWHEGSLEFDMIVFDEAHLMESSSKDGHNKGAHLRKYKCNFRLLVTGTLFTSDSLKGIKNQMLFLNHWDKGLCVEPHQATS
jgi:superfamily II DNA or RNA helicase